MSEAQRNEAPLDQRVGRLALPMPGGIRLTVTERCEIDDWCHACASAAASDAASTEREQIKADILRYASNLESEGEDARAVRAFWALLCLPRTSYVTPNSMLSGTSAG